MRPMRLPRRLAEFPEAGELSQQLVDHAEFLWPDGEIAAAAVTGEVPELCSVLARLRQSDRVVRGLEGAQRLLAAEQTGLEHAEQARGVERGGRVSRLLILSGDGSERFYRDSEALLRRHFPRVLALRVELDEAELGASVFGPGQRARLLMLSRKDSVTDLLLALARHWSPG